jgi:hypothetical protein
MMPPGIFHDQAIYSFTSVEAAASAGNEKDCDMIDASRRAATILASMAAATFMIGQPALAQGPTDAQRAAIKSQCRSDYIAHCSSVTPGGAAALQCLQKNMASLSGGCQSAVRAVEASVEKPKADTKTDAKTDTKTDATIETKTESKPETKPDAAPATATAKPAAEPEAKPAAAPAAKTTTTAAKPATSAAPNKPSDAQIAAIRSSCRSDYPKVCAGVPTGGAPALQCLEKNKSKLSAGCAQAVAAAGGGAATPTAAATPGTEGTASPNAAAPAAAPLLLRPMRPREVLFVVRSACGADVRALCAGVDPGGGRIIQCLATQSASLSPDCRSVLGQFAAR